MATLHNAPIFHGIILNMHICKLDFFFFGVCMPTMMFTCMIMTSRSLYVNIHMIGFRYRTQCPKIYGGPVHVRHNTLKLLIVYFFVLFIFIVIFSFTNTNTKGEFYSQKASRFVQTFSCTVDPLNSIQFSSCFLELITFNDPLKKDLRLLGIHPLLSTQPNSPSLTLCLADVASNVSVTTIDESKLCWSWNGY
jgi:hypothetical protein